MGGRGGGPGRTVVCLVTTLRHVSLVTNTPLLGIPRPEGEEDLPIGPVALGNEGVGSRVEAEVPVHVRREESPTPSRIRQDRDETTIGPQATPATPVEGNETDGRPETILVQPTTTPVPAAGRTQGTRPADIVVLEVQTTGLPRDGPKVAETGSVVIDISTDEASDTMTVPTLSP